MLFTMDQVAAIVYFWIGGWLLGNGFVLNCVVTLVLVAADFWTVKNVTGRLLVGLRWWNDDGTESSGGESTWRFESLEEVGPGLGLVTCGCAKT